MDGPTTDEVTLQVSGEREGSPSTAVRYPSGSVALPSQWLLIGEGPCFQFQIDEEKSLISLIPELEY